MITVALFALSFVAMEGIAYSTHRWVMHRRGMVWHASHHAPPRGRLERNDLFPLCFSLLGASLFVAVAIGMTPAWVWPVAAGTTAYGITYLVVHEVVIHRRLPLQVPNLRYLRWLRDSHRAHHVDAGEPYGMLLPVMSSADKKRVTAAKKRVRSARQPASDEGGRDLLVRARTRPTRWRL